MAPPARNHKFAVTVLAPPMNFSATNDALNSYPEWMRMTMPILKEKKKTRKGPNLDFSDFPSDLVESILERLSSADRIRFGATCQKNLSFVTTQQHYPQYQFRTIDRLPWLATFNCLPNGSFGFRLFQPLRGRPHYADYQIRDLKGDTLIKASKKGWFLCSWPNEEEQGMASFLLFSPFNKRIIQLPDLGHYLNNEINWESYHATFSSDDPSSPDCVFFFLSQEEESTPEQICISTLEDQKTGKWKTKLFDKLIVDVSSVVYHEGCFYCLSALGELAAYDVVQQTWNLIVARYPLSNLPSSVVLAGLDSYLVVCEGKLILAYKPPFASNHNDVVDCGLCEFTSSTSRWVEKTSLGDHALFLGYPTPFSVPVPSSSNVADRMYFYTFMIDEGNCPIYYSFKDGRCHLFEDGDYWSSHSKGRMWIEPPSPF